MACGRVRWIGICIPTYAELSHVGNAGVGGILRQARISLSLNTPSGGLAVCRMAVRIGNSRCIKPLSTKSNLAKMVDLLSGAGALVLSSSPQARVCSWH